MLAGLLFAGLSTGGRYMETQQGVPLDLVSVIQALVVLFIAAPPLVRTLIGLRRVDNPGAGERRRRARAASGAGEDRTGATRNGGSSVASTSSAATRQAPSFSGSSAAPDPAEPPGSAERSGTRTETKGEDR